jgi:hypothetical protein
MELVEDGNGLRIEGTGSERARIAFASKKDGRLVFTLQAATEQEARPQAVLSQNSRFTA